MYKHILIDLDDTLWDFRRNSKIAMQENYLENFLQSIFNTIPNLNKKSFLVGGDGRYFNKIAIQKIIKIASANGVKKLFVGTRLFVVETSP